MERNKLYIDRAHNENIRSWILGTLTMKRKLKKCPQTENSRFLMDKWANVDAIAA